MGETFVIVLLDSILLSMFFSWWLSAPSDSKPPQKKEPIADYRERMDRKWWRTRPDNVRCRKYYD